MVAIENAVFTTFSQKNFTPSLKRAFLRQNVAVYLVKNLSPQVVAIENGKNMPFLKKFLPFTIYP